MRPAPVHSAERDCAECVVAAAKQGSVKARVCVRGGSDRKKIGRIATFYVGAAALCSPALAQSSPGGFSLPEPSPSPAPAPQGPVDIRDGVVIGPRVIEDSAIERPAAERQAPTATSPPRPMPAPSPLSAPTPTARGAGTQARPTGANEAPAEPADGADGASAPLNVQTPADEALTDPASIDPNPADARDSSLPRQRDAEARALELRVYRPGLFDMLRAYEGWILAALALLAALIAWLVIAARRRKDLKRLAPPGAAAEHEERTREVSREGKRETAFSATSLAARSGPGPGDSPPPIDLRLDVVDASRSVRFLMLDVNLTLSNRSGFAVRGLSVAAKLDCARPGEEGIGPGASQPLGEIARIGPHQGASLSGRLELPVAELRLISHGNGRVFIPLVHVTFEGEAVPATMRSFVIGTPSASGAGRLHPLPVAAPIGAIHGLAAQPVRVPECSETRSRPAHAAA